MEIIGFLSLVIGSIIFRGLVLVNLWTWFMVPIFDLPVLSIPQAIGVGLVTSFSTGSSPGKKNNDTEGTKKDVIGTFVNYAIVLTVGFIITLFL